MTKLSGDRVESDFDRTTQLTSIPGSSGEFSVDLDPGWSSLVGVHGGYLCALAVRAAQTLEPSRFMRTITTSFLRTGAVGPASLSVHIVRRGRSMTTAVAEVSQEGRLLTTSRLTMLEPRSGVEWSRTVRLDLPPVEHCVRMEGGPIAHFQRADGLLDPDSMPFAGGRHALVQGYVRPLDGQRVDSSWLAMASDWFPPPAFVKLEPPTGGVSIDLTTHIHKPTLVLGDDEWLTGKFEIETSTGGLAVEHGLLATLDGVLVAESFQTRLTAKD